MILKVFLQDENGAKSTATAEGGPEEMERKVEEFRKLFTKHHMSIVDYKILSNDGSEGTLAKKKETCLNCGRFATTVFHKTNRTAEGITVAVLEIPMCHKDFLRYGKDENFRVEMWVLGLKMHIAGED